MEEMDVTSYAIRTEKRPTRMTHRADEGIVEEVSFKMCCTDCHKKQQDDNRPKNYLGFVILNEAHKVKKTPLT